MPRKRNVTSPMATYERLMRLATHPSSRDTPEGRLAREKAEAIKRKAERAETEKKYKRAMAAAKRQTAKEKALRSLKEYTQRKAREGVEPGVRGLLNPATGKWIKAKAVRFNRNGSVSIKR